MSSTPVQTPKDKKNKSTTVLLGYLLRATELMVSKNAGTIWKGSHSFLNEYIRKNNCKRIMEIGVFNGENAKTMVEAAAEKSPLHEVEYYGFDVFGGDLFRQARQKLERTGSRFRLFEGNTLHTLPEIVNSLPKMDLIFIDGGKSYAVIKNDWDNSKTLMHDGTAVFVHNYELPGVRRMVDGIPKNEYWVKIIHLQSEPETIIIRKKPQTAANVV